MSSPSTKRGCLAAAIAGAQVRDACPHLDRLADHVSRFAVMVTALRGDRLDAWLTAVDIDDQPELRSFAAGIRRDYYAVRNGLTLRGARAAGPLSHDGQRADTFV